MACVVRIFGHLMYFLPFYPLMQQAKEESLVAMQCLQSELEAVRECLREREVELEVARLSLADRDANLAGLQGQWGRKEAELHRVRAELLQGVEEIARLRDSARERAGEWLGADQREEGGEGEEEAERTELELEVRGSEAREGGRAGGRGEMPLGGVWNG